MQWQHCLLDVCPCGSAGRLAPTFIAARVASSPLAAPALPPPQSETQALAASFDPFVDDETGIDYYSYQASRAGLATSGQAFRRGCQGAPEWAAWLLDPGHRPLLQ